MELFCFLLVPTIRLSALFAQWMHMSAVCSNLFTWVHDFHWRGVGYPFNKTHFKGVGDIQTILWTSLSSLIKWAVICVKVWLSVCPTFYVRHSFKMRKSKQRACSSVLREFRTSLLFRTRRRRKKSQNKVEAGTLHWGWEPNKWGKGGTLATLLECLPLCLGRREVCIMPPGIQAFNETLVPLSGYLDCPAFSWLFTAHHCLG